jgi:hypothetical protein
MLLGVMGLCIVPCCSGQQSGSASAPLAVVASGVLPDAPMPAGQLQQQAETPGTLRGTVTDSSGALVQNATVTLTLSGTTQERHAVTSADGAFLFEGVPPGSFHVAITAAGLHAGEAAGVLKAGEDQTIPTIQLPIATQNTEVDVTFTKQELGEAEVQSEEKQRLLGIVPNFSVAYDWNAPPMTTRQKYDVAFKLSFDPVSIILAAGFAGYEQARNDIPGYGPGAAGYAKRAGAAIGTQAIGTFLTGAVYPEIFRQDPRYFWKGSGTVKSRLLYAISTVVICRSDKDGHWMPNYSNVLGDFTAGAVSNIYYPPSSREGVGLTFENGALAMGFGALSSVIQEFLLHRVTPHLPRATPAPVTPGSLPPPA